MSERLPDSNRTAENQPEDDLVVAYVTSELSGEARMQFEARLADEPELVAQVQQFEELDLMGTVLAASSGNATAAAGSGSRFPKILPWITVLAAAMVAILIALGKGGILGDRGIQCQARVVASLAAEDTSAYAEALGMPAGTRIEGDGTRGASNAAPAMPVDEFLASVERAEGIRSSNALAAPPAAQGPAPQGYVTLRFRVDRECSGIVFHAAPDGSLQRLYPSPTSRFVFGEVANRFTPNATHTLPRPNATRNQLGLVHLHSGFAANAGSMQLALCEQEVPAELLVEFDQILAEQPLSGALTWLAERGFTVQTVSGPRGK